MGIFGRKNRTEPADTVEPADTPQVRDVPAGEPGVDRAWRREVDGPFDVAEEPEMGVRLDLGTLRVPAAKGMELRIDVEKGSNRMVGVTCGVGGSQLQLQAFAAPKSQGIWDEVRAEIAEGIVGAGGTAEATDGVMGTELRCRMPGVATDGRVAFQPARFVGVDGPRWFLRGVVNGPAASDETQYRLLLAYLRRVVVVRGEEARPPREVMTLTAPQQILEAAQQQAAARKATATAARQPGGAQ